MSAANLLTMAGLITKDPSHNKYSESLKYQMLSIAQRALVRRLHLKFLRNITEEASLAFTDSKTDAPTNFFRPVYMEVSGSKLPVDLIEVSDLSLLQNTNFGGDDESPRYFVYVLSGVTKLKYRATSTEQTVVFYYIKEPTDVSASQDEVVIGFDNLILDFFKYLFHMAEGQTDLAGQALQHFESTIDRMNKEAIENGNV